MTELVDASTGALTRQSFDAWGNKRDVSDWTIPATYNLFADRGFTGHEHLEEFELINMNGRVYDPALGRFLSPDPYVQMPDFSQSFNRYSYCLNNPLIYTDPDGEWFAIDDAIAAAVGGVINLATNWKNIDNFWEGLASFGAGAANGWLTLNIGPVGAVIGGGITGATNNIIAQTGNGVGLKQVDWGQVGFNGIVGSATGIAGYGAGQWASNNLGSALINGSKVSSPVLSRAINGAIGGAIGGYAGGFTAGYLFSGGNLNTALQSGWNGMKVGGALGGGLGAASGYKYSKKNNINPRTGKSLTPNQKGENGVNRAIQDIESMGGKIIGERPAKYNLEGGRSGYTDLIVELQGEIVIVEVKNGPSASLNSNQKINYARINSGEITVFSGPNGSVVPQNTTIRVIVIHYSAIGRVIYSPYK